MRGGINYPFSSLFIGIWAAAPLSIKDPYSLHSFQFPLHRDLGCSALTFLTPALAFADFQFPLHRDLGCSTVTSLSISRPMPTFSSLFIGIWAAARGNRHFIKSPKYLSVPSSQGFGLQRSNLQAQSVFFVLTFSSLFIGIWAAARYCHKSQMDCYALSVPSSQGFGLQQTSLQTMLNLMRIFQFPLHRDLGCSID